MGLVQDLVQVHRFVFSAAVGSAPSNNNTFNCCNNIYNIINTAIIVSGLLLQLNYIIICRAHSCVDNTY